MAAPYRRPPVQECAAHGPYRAWRPTCPDCVREQEAAGRRQERLERLEQRPAPVPYGEFPPGF